MTLEKIRQKIVEGSLSIDDIEKLCHVKQKEAAYAAFLNSTINDSINEFTEPISLLSRRKLVTSNVNGSGGSVTFDFNSNLPSGKLQSYRILLLNDAIGGGLITVTDPDSDPYELTREGEEFSDGVTSSKDEITKDLIITLTQTSGAEANRVMIFYTIAP